MSDEKLKQKRAARKVQLQEKKQAADMAALKKAVKRLTIDAKLKDKKLIRLKSNLRSIEMELQSVKSKLNRKE